MAVDMHASVLADIAQILRSQGHAVNLETLSSHAWVLDRNVSRLRGLHAPRRLTSLLRRDVLHIDQPMCDRFFRLNRNRLKEYDAFVVSYPPAFALLFEKFQKPVIVSSCTRFDFPCQDPKRLEWLRSGLSRMHEKGLLVPVANNRLDQAVSERYFPFRWKHIPSLCDYMTGTYEPENEEALLWFRGSPQLENHYRSLHGIDANFSISERYDRATIRFSKAVVHIPYQLSIMSAFEHYAQGIPMLVPSSVYLREMAAAGAPVLSEVLFPGSTLALPENYIELADFYDEDNFRHMVKFESDEDLIEKLAFTDWEAVSASMSSFHSVRRDQVHSGWKSIMDEVA